MFEENICRETSGEKSCEENICRETSGQNIFKKIIGRETSGGKFSNKTFAEKHLKKSKIILARKKWQRHF